MTNLYCSNTIIEDGLAVYIDISNTDSWDLNSGYTLTSLRQWKGAISDTITLNDYGLTAYDVARTNTLTATTNVTIFDKKLTLYRIGENNASGTTSYSNYALSATTGTSVGNFFDLNGGYLQGYFKLYDYNYEILPYRYNDGITIESWVKINSNTFSSITGDTEGFFYYMGTRAENKYSIMFSGDTGYTTSLGNTLGYDNSDSGTTTGTTIDYESGVYDNVIGFRVTSDSRIGYRYINSTGLTEEQYSSRIIDVTGWTYISIVYCPYSKFKDISEDILSCYARRLGDLIFYINGREFFKIKDFSEFYFTELNTEKEKQLGVPFNISVGGGAIGLKSSFNFSGGTSQIPYSFDSRKRDLLIEKSFDGNFIGGFQKLRIYVKALNPQEILHNFDIEKSNFGLTNNNGGRVIYV